MIDWVEQRLINWGRHMHGGRGGSSGGWPFVLVHIRSTTPPGTILDPDVMEIDDLLMRLRENKPKWYETAINLYYYTLSPELIAVRMKCHVSTVHERRGSMQNWMRKQITARAAV